MSGVKDKAKAEAYQTDINRQFSAVMMGIDEDDRETRDSMLKEYSLQQKVALIKALAKAADLEGDVIEYLSSIIDEGPTIKVLDELEKQVGDPPETWVELFAEAGGCEWVVDSLVALVHKPSNLKSKSKSSEDIQIIQQLIRIILSFVSSAVGEVFLDIPGTFKNLMLTLDYVNTESSISVFEIFTTSMLDTEEYVHVTEALQFFTSLFPNGWTKLLDSLRTNVDLKVAYFVVVNTVITTTKNTRKRADFRQKYMPQEILLLMREDELEEEIAQQIEIYEEDIAIDMKQSASAGDSIDVASTITSVRGTPIEPLLKSVFDGLSQTKEKQRFVTWRVLNRFLRHLAATKNANNMDALASFLKSEYQKEGKIISEKKDIKETGTVLMASRRSTVRQSQSQQTPSDKEESFMDAVLAAREAAAVASALSSPTADQLLPSNEPAKPPPGPPMKGPPPGPPMKGPPGPPMKGPPKGPPGPGGAFNKTAAPTVVRPAMVPFRWNPIPASQLDKTVFRSLTVATPTELDLDLLQETFLVEVKEESSANKEAAEEPAEQKARILSAQRLQTIEIIMNRLKLPLDEVKRAILTADEQVLQFNVINELLGLFPLKNYEEEKNLMTAFTGDKKTLVKPELFFYELITIPRVRELLATISFTKESTGRIRELKENANSILRALGELKNPMMLQLIETCLAVGNYLNSGGKNAKGPAAGFRISSLLKMNEVVAKTSRTSLLGFIIKEIEKNNPTILQVFDSQPSLNAAATAVGQIQTERPALTKAINELKAEIVEQRALSQKSPIPNDKLISSLTNAYDDLSITMDQFSIQMKKIEDEVLWWGEPDVNAFNDFFPTWIKFVQLFQKIIKQNQEQDKRESTKKEKQAKAEKKAADKTQSDALMRFSQEVRRKSNRGGNEVEDNPRRKSSKPGTTVEELPRIAIRKSSRGAENPTTSTGNLENSLRATVINRRESLRASSHPDSRTAKRESWKKS